MTISSFCPVVVETIARPAHLKLRKRGHAGLTHLAAVDHILGKAAARHARQLDLDIFHFLYRRSSLGTVLKPCPGCGAPAGMWSLGCECFPF